MNENILQFSVNGDIPDEYQLLFEKCGKLSNGEQCSLLLTLRRDTSVYQRNGADLIQTLTYSEKYSGETIYDDLILPNGLTEKILINLSEGDQITLNNHGMIKEDGTRGNLIVKIHLESIGSNL